MLPVLADHINRLDQQAPDQVIPWACPVPYFGAAHRAAVATVGINPSDLEFTDGDGRELDGRSRRLPTLKSLGLRSWADADAEHLREVELRCTRYFTGRPYDRWFGVLERVLRPASLSYYGDEATACHVDLFAFATKQKWGALAAQDRRRMLETTNAQLGLLMRLMPARLFVLNGRSVLEAFTVATQVKLAPSRMTSWDLPRSSKPVRGVAYLGVVDEVGGVPLGRRVTVAGFNHNLQSSFGVTANVLDEVGCWVASLVDRPS